MEGREGGKKEGSKEGSKEGRKEGRKGGREEGRKGGMKEARKEGRKEGRKQGSKEARKEGRKEGRKEVSDPEPVNSAPKQYYSSESLFQEILFKFEAYFSKSLSVHPSASGTLKGIISWLNLRILSFSEERLLCHSSKDFKK